MGWALSPPQLSPLGAAAPRGPWPGLPLGMTASVPHCRGPSCHGDSHAYLGSGFHSCHGAAALEGGGQVSPPPGRPSGCSESQDQDQHWACETSVQTRGQCRGCLSSTWGRRAAREEGAQSFGGGAVFLFSVPGQKQPIPSAPTAQTGKLRPEVAGLWGPRGVGGCAEPEPRPPGQCTPRPCGAWNHSIQEAGSRDPGRSLTTLSPAPQV